MSGLLAMVLSTTLVSFYPEDSTQCLWRFPQRQYDSVTFPYWDPPVAGELIPANIDGVVFYAPRSVVGLSNQPFVVPLRWTLGCSARPPTDIVYIIDNRPTTAVCDTQCLRAQILNELLGLQLPSDGASALYRGTAAVIAFGGHPGLVIPPLDISSFQDSQQVNSGRLRAAADSLTARCADDDAGPRGLGDAMRTAMQWMSESALTQDRNIVVITGRIDSIDTELRGILDACLNAAPGDTLPRFTFGLMCTDTVDSILSGLADCSGGNAVVVDSAAGLDGTRIGTMLRTVGDIFWGGEMFTCYLRSRSPDHSDSVALRLCRAPVGGGAAYGPWPSRPLRLSPGTNVIEFFGIASHPCINEYDTLSASFSVIVDSGGVHSDRYGAFSPSCTSSVRARPKPRSPSSGSWSIPRIAGPNAAVYAQAQSWVRVTDIRGKLVAAARATVDGWLQIPLPPRFGSGVYFLSVFHEGEHRSWSITLGR